MLLNIDASIMARAVLLHHDRRKMLRILLSIVAVIVVLCCIYLWHDPRFHWQVIGLLALTALMLLLMSPVRIWLVRRTLQKQFRQMAEAGDDVSQVDVTYDENTITFATAKSRQVCEWSAFTNHYEKDGLLLLYRNAHFFHVLPLAQIPQDVQDDIHRLLQHPLPPKG